MNSSAEDYSDQNRFIQNQLAEWFQERFCVFCILGTNLICQRFEIVPSITRQLFIRPEYEKVHTIYQRFSYTRDDLIVDEYSNRPE